MILIDFGIICLEQSQKSFPEDIQNVRFESYTRTAYSKPMYNEWYHFQDADKLVGVWYFAWLTEDIAFEESFFEIDDKGCPWIYVESKWKRTVKDLLEFYIQESPIHQIAVILRVQDESNNASHSVCTVNEFMKSLELGNTRWNELYYISG